MKPPTVLCFLNVYARASGIIDHMKIYNLARFLSDMSVLVHLNSVFLPSIIAMSVLRFALQKVINSNQQGSIPVQKLEKSLQSTILHSSLSQKEMMLCNEELSHNLLNFQHDILNKDVLTKKYQSFEIKQLIECTADSDPEMQMYFA